MVKMSKRSKLIQEQIDKNKIYHLVEAFQVLKSLPPVKFNETVEVSINLGVDTSKFDQVVRGSVVLPNGSGKKVRVAAFVQGDYAKIAEDAGADIVGFEELADKIKAGEIDFEVLIATPDAMRLIGQLGQILGPRGLMPNPKLGTVTSDVATAVKNAKGGQVTFRADKGGIVHSRLGKLDFTIEQIDGNLRALLSEIKKLKPSSAKGVYLKKMVLSSTMGPGLILDMADYQ